MRVWALVVAVVAGAASAVADEPRPTDLAERYNEQGRDLFGKGELQAAIKKFRAAIAIDPQARFFFNLCFVLNARYQLEAALGACEAVADAAGADDRLEKRAAELIDVIKKKRAADRPPPDKPEKIKVTDEDGEPVLESKPLPPDTGAGGGDPERAVQLPPEPRRYPPPIAGNTNTPPTAVRIVSDRPEPPARSFHVGLIAGFSFAHVEAQGDLFDGQTSGGSTGFTGGGFVSTSLDKILVGQAEVVYIQRGGGADNGIDASEDLSLDYLSFPLLGKFQLPLGRTKIHLDLGFSLSFLVSSSDGAGDPSAVEAGFVIGGGMTFYRRGSSALIFDLRHESGLSDAVSVDPIAVKNRTWTLRVGYGF
jgi:hypothetical protein